MDRRDKKQIWVRIGDYGTEIPFETYGKFLVEKSDPLIKECLQKYKQRLLDDDIPLKEPIQVIGRRRARDEEEYDHEDMFGVKIKDIRLDYKLKELH